MKTKEQKPIIISLQPSHVKVFNFIEHYISKFIFSPFLTEVSKGTRMSPRQAYNIINELAALGYIEKQHRKKRGLRILKNLV